jgi:phenylalanyl-tRNA synthetase alpha chain
MVEKLNQLLTAFEGSLSEKNLQAEVLNLKSEYLGKNGHISEILKSLKDASLEEKKVLGPLANEIKEKINELTAKKLNDL